MSATPATESPYARENYWGELNDQNVPRGHDETTGTDAAEYIAFNLIKQFVDPICNRTMNEPPWNGGREAELCAWLFDGQHIDGHGDQLHRRQTVRGLSDPEIYLPKQVDKGSHLKSYGQCRLRRRFNPESGYINFGETTSTGIPEIDENTYTLAVHRYLWDRLIQAGQSDDDDGLRLTSISEYLDHANRLWHDPQYNSHGSLEQFIRYVREQEDDTQ